MHIDLHFLLTLELIMFFMFIYLRNICMTLTMINWDMIQVEPEGEFLIEPMRILDRKVTMLWN